MSRFFRGSDSESESSSNEEEIVPQRPAVSKAFQFSDEDDDAKRVVRSAKDKRFDEIRNIIRQLKNHKKIKDMSNVLTDFESLGKAYDKAKKVFVISNEEAPRFYVRCLVELEDFVNQCWEDKDGRRQMSKNNAKGLTTLRQRLRKYNRTFEQEIKSYRENPDIGDPDVSDEEEESDSDDIDNDIEDVVIDNELLKNFKKSPVTDVVEDISSKFKQAVVDLESEDADDGEDENYVDWGDQDETGDKSSDDQGDSTYLASLFLKRTTAAEAAKKEEKKREKRKDKKGKKRDDEDDDDDDDEGEWEEVKGGAPMLMEKPKMFGKDVEINHEAVIKKLNEIVSARGKKGTDRSEQIDILKELLSVSEAHKLGPAMSSKIIFNIIAAIFDYNPNIATNMKPEMWERCKDYVLMQLSLLLEHKDITVSENMTEDSENLEEPPYRIRGCILTVVERMDEEFKKMLQGCDPHSTEYIERLKDERVVCDVIEKLQGYLEDEKVPTKEMCRGYLRRIEHTYYKTNGGEEAKELIARLCKYIYSKDQTDRLRTRAILCHIYHHAIHDRWFEARDLMLMSHLQDTIQHSDITTQIQYNRTLVQLGLCAFRQGMIKDSHNALVDIQSIGRAKELLAQGLLLQRQHERTPEQELIEKRRQMPYHMHINLELLECVYLVSAMLIEIPYMAAHEFDGRRRMISRNYHNLLRNSERQTLTGPPESMREHIVAASKSMKTGNWCACTKFVINEKMNAKVWDLFNDADKVRKMIRQKIQEESLRTYLFTYSSVYDTLSMVKLGEMFELETSVVHAIISKMIFNEELMASLDEPTQSIVMHRTEPSRLQSLALQLSEKISNLVDNNDRIIDMKPGSTYYQKSGLSGYDQGQQQNRWSKGQNQWDKGQRQNQWGGRSQQNQWGRRQQRMRVY